MREAVRNFDQDDWMFEDHFPASMNMAFSVPVGVDVGRKGEHCASLYASRFLGIASSGLGIAASSDPASPTTTTQHHQQAHSQANNRAAINH